MNIVPEPEESNKRVVGMFYVPKQKFIDLYEPDIGLPRGTIFKQLDLPFTGEEVE